MLKIEKFVTPSPEQWEIVIEGMRNPKNSWDRMDSYITYVENPETLVRAPLGFFLGEKDLGLCDALDQGGPVHAKYRRMLPVHVTINAPLYWWKEFDTYRVGVCPNPMDIEMNSCSTMHKIHAKEFTLEDFSCEHLNEAALFTLNNTIMDLNFYRGLFIDKDLDDKKCLENHHMTKKGAWYQMIQLLPTSYNQKRTLSLNYEVLANMHTWRRNHKLDEWHVVCDWIEELPNSELITGIKE